MEKNKKYYMTHQQHWQLEDELKQLKQVGRKKVAAEIKEARLLGNLANNKAYNDAKDKQRDLEARIDELERMLKNAEILYEENRIPDQVMLGSVVKIHDLEYDEYEKYTIVEHDKVNSLKNKISNESPLGKALMGGRVGETIIVKTPAGNVQYKILELVDFLEEYRDYSANDNGVSNNSSRKNSKVDTIDILPQHFITRVNTFHCSAEKHDIVDIMCRVKISRPNGVVDTVLVPGAYCDTCKRFYILEVEYEKLKYQGVPLCRIVEYDFWTDGNQSDFYGLNKESLLHMMGYNVNAQENLTTKQRWKILETIADAKILSVTEIRSHLEWLIRRSYNNINFENARAKWECDSKHMAQYEADKRQVVNVASISKKNYRKK